MDEAKLFTSLLLFWFCLQFRLCELSAGKCIKCGNYYDFFKREDLSLVASVKLILLHCKWCNPFLLDLLAIC